MGGAPGTHRTGFPPSREWRTGLSLRASHGVVHRSGQNRSSVRLAGTYGQAVTFS